MRERFDRLEEIINRGGSEPLRQRVRALRSEWEEIQHDPQKLRVFAQKINLLRKDMEEGKYYAAFLMPP